MKNSLKIFAISLLICVAALITTNVQADEPPPPPPGHGSTGNQTPGGGAPIGSGLVILLSLGAGYGAKKFYNYRKNKEEE